MTNTVYRVFLFSSDVGRLTLEGDFNTEQEAKDCVQDWIGDRDWDEELAAGRFQIQTRLNSHLKMQYTAYAHAYPILEKPKNVEGENIEAYQERITRYHSDLQTDSKPIMSHVPFPTHEAAEQAIDEAIDNLAQDLDIRLYGRVTRARREAGIHERYLTDLTEFGFKVYRGDGPRSQYDESVTIDDIKAIRFPEAGNSVSQFKGFNVESGALRVTDPCYSMGTWCAGTSTHVKNGRWLAQVGRHREAVDGYVKERFEKEIAELEQPQERERIKQLEEAFAHIPEEDRLKAQEQLDNLLNYYQTQGLREFGRMWGNPDDWQGRVAFLHIRHESVMNEPIDLSLFVHNNTFQVGVDSGQAGFFDLDKYEAALKDKPENGHDDGTRFEQFYDACGANTLGSEMWGTVEGFGCVSSSGYGDGGYALYERRDEVGELVEARIVYMSQGSEALPGIIEEEDEEE